MGRRPISQRPGRAAHPAPRQWDEIVKAAQSLLRENTDRVDGIKEGVRSKLAEIMPTRD